MTTYRASLEPHLRALSTYFPQHSLDEQAVPSYTHRNPLMAWLFWQRLYVVMHELRREPIGRALDFGCGTGVLLPFLLRHAEMVIGYDINPQASQMMITRLGLGDVTLLNPNSGLTSLRDGSMKTIIALDVLEHVEDLDATVAEFTRVLASDGRVIISGPTESALYRLGRRLAGFTQHFHVRTIYDIEHAFARTFNVTVAAQLYWPVPLFRISVSRPRR
jgi:2-polyprenyl-3-methyl-5-hydroxy-6-metoxy-1,4-benzoquinol methylase